MNPDRLPVSWFDIAVLLLMLSGMVHGRRNGLSVELLDVIKWLTVIVLGNLYYPPIGNWLAAKANITHNYADLFVYVAIMLTVLSIFQFIKKVFHGKLIAAQRFGSMEMRLGLFAGSIRYLCYIFVGIAVLNTPIYEPQEVAVPLAYFQKEIIYNSATGLFVRQYFGDSLIEPVPETSAEKISVAKRQEWEIDKVMQRP